MTFVIIKISVIVNLTEYNIISFYFRTYWLLDIIMCYRQTFHNWVYFFFINAVILNRKMQIYLLSFLKMIKISNIVKGVSISVLYLEMLRSKQNRASRICKAFNNKSLQTLSDSTNNVDAGRKVCMSLLYIYIYIYIKGVP